MASRSQFAVNLLSPGQLIRNLLTDHLSPAFRPPAISYLPSVLGKTGEASVLRKGGFVGEDRKKEVACTAGPPGPSIQS